MKEKKSILKSITSINRDKVKAYRQKRREKILANKEKKRLLFEPYIFHTNEHNKLMTPEMQEFNKLKISDEHKLEILKKEYMAYYNKDLKKNRLLTVKIATKIKEFMDFHKPVLFEVFDLLFVQTTSLNDYKFRVAVKSLIYSGLTIGTIGLMNKNYLFPNKEFFQLCGAVYAVFGVLGIYKYRKIRDKYRKQDVMTMMTQLHNKTK